jgi:hypothetical protein
LTAVALTLTTATSARAEYRQIELSIFGMD